MRTNGENTTAVHASDSPRSGKLLTTDVHGRASLTLAHFGLRKRKRSASVMVRGWIRKGKVNNLDNGEKQLCFCARQPPRAVGMADTEKEVVEKVFGFARGILFAKK